jgi:hypothetical protein
LQAHRLSVDHDIGDSQTGSINADAKDVKIVHVVRQVDNVQRRQFAESHRKLLTAAYLLAVDGQPLSTFGTVVKALHATGTPSIEGRKTERDARELIGHLANSIRTRIGRVLNCASALAILCDGAGARAATAEKAMLLVRAVTGGESKYFVASLLHTNGCNRTSLKNAVDDVLRRDLGVQNHAEKLISVTVDGRASNAQRCALNDLPAQMSTDGRSWVVGIHCVHYQLEQAIKETLTKNKALETVKDVMVLMHALTKQSDEFRRSLRRTAAEHQIDIRTFPRVHGDRLLERQRKGLEALLHNWLPLLLTIDKFVGDDEAIRSRLNGVAKQMADARVLAAACVYKAIVDVAADLTRRFSDSRLLPFDVNPSAHLFVDRLQDLLVSCKSLIEMAGITLMDGVLHGQFPVHGGNRHINDDADRKYEYTSVEYAFMTHHDEADLTAERLKRAVIPEIIDIVRDRFCSFNCEIFRSMHWTDAANWRDKEDNELAHIQVAPPVQRLYRIYVCDEISCRRVDKSPPALRNYFVDIILDIYEQKFQLH